MTASVSFSYIVIDKRLSSRLLPGGDTQRDTNFLVYTSESLLSNSDKEAVNTSNHESRYIGKKSLVVNRIDFASQAVTISHRQKKVVMMMIDGIDQLDTLTDTQLWEVAADTHNAAEIRQQAIQRWLFPSETNPDTDPDDLGGGRLRELRQRATVLDSDEMGENDIEDVEEMAPYFDTQGRLILEHDGVSYLIDSLDDEGAYDGISNRNDLFTTDDKTNMARDL